MTSFQPSKSIASLLAVGIEQLLGRPAVVDVVLAHLASHDLVLLPAVYAASASRPSLLFLPESIYSQMS